MSLIRRIWKGKNDYVGEQIGILALSRNAKNIGSDTPNYRELKVRKPNNMQGEMTHVTSY